MIVCGIHLGYVHTVLVNLDFLGQEVKPFVVSVDDDFAVFGAGRIMSEFPGKIVGETVAHVGGLVVHGVEHPVVLGGKPHQRNVVSRHVIVKARLETVGLLAVSLRGGAAPLNADTADVVQVGSVVLIAQVVDCCVVDIENLHRCPDFGLVRNAGAVVGVDDDDG